VALFLDKESKMNKKLKKINTLLTTTVFVFGNQVMAPHAMDVSVKLEQPASESIKYNYTPVRRGQPGHEDMLQAYIHIKQENDQLLESNPKYRGKNSAVKLRQNELTPAKSSGHTTEITLISQETTTVGKDLADRGFKVGIVVFGNKKKPGGGYVTGDLAQEEDTCRRAPGIYYQSISATNLYPLASDELVYTKRIPVLRGDWTTQFNLLKTPVDIDVLTQPAINLNFTASTNDLAELGITKEKHYNYPEGTNLKTMKFAEKKPYLDSIKEAVLNDPNISKNHENRVKEKIRAQLRVFSANGMDAPVLGATGCGVFENPPEKVAKFTREVLEENEFNGVFKVIAFSILARDITTDVNYQAFFKELKNIKGYTLGIGFNQ
jgi:hypothetical protein